MVALKFKKVGIKKLGPKSTPGIQKVVASFKKYVRSSKSWDHVQKVRMEFKSSSKTKNPDQKWGDQKVIYSIKKPAPKSKSNSGSKSWVQKPKSYPWFKNQRGSKSFKTPTKTQKPGSKVQKPRGEQKPPELRVKNQKGGGQKADQNLGQTQKPKSQKALI